MTQLEAGLIGFKKMLANRQEFKVVNRTVGQLRDNQNWKGWGERPGVYSFIVAKEVVYVGRAISAKGVGARLWSHLRETRPIWQPVVQDRDTVMQAILCPLEDGRCIASALEAYLIEKLHPRINRNCQ